jgi:hypothetical protein
LRALPPKLTKPHREAVAAHMAMLPYAQQRSIGRTARRHANKYWHTWTFWSAGALIPWIVVILCVLHRLPPKSLMLIGMLGMSLGLPLFWIGSFISVRIKNYSVASHFPYLCPTCGYDLTANTSGVCPECGDKIKLKASRTPATS